MDTHVLSIKKKKKDCKELKELRKTLNIAET